MSESSSFNALAFFTALDTVREDRGLSWRQAAQQAGVSQSTLTRMAQGKRPDVDSLAKLANWSKLSVDSFIVRASGPPVGDGGALAQISTYLRADRSLSPATAEALETVIRATYNALKDRG